MKLILDETKLTKKEWDRRIKLYQEKADFYGKVQIILFAVSIVFLLISVVLRIVLK